jgi:hypothetical protein
MMLFMSPAAAQAEDPAFVQVCSDRPHVTAGLMSALSFAMMDMLRGREINPQPLRLCSCLLRLLGSKHEHQSWMALLLSGPGAYWGPDWFYDILQEHSARSEVLARAGPALLPALFALVQQLEEVESKVRVLQLVSVSVEVLGEAAGPLLGSVAAALPMVRARYL